MPDYRRYRVAGVTYFFTVNLANRDTSLLTEHIDVRKTCNLQEKPLSFFARHLNDKGLVILMKIAGENAQIQLLRDDGYAQEVDRAGMKIMVSSDV